MDTVAASISIEVEAGTVAGHAHPHNGYYAGDFSGRPVTPAAWHEPIVSFDPQRS